LTLETQEVLLRAGHAYLIPGYHLVRQECLHRMDVYWVHFVPDSLYLTFLLSHVARVHQWRPESLEYWRATCKELPRLFQSGGRRLFYRVQAMLMDLVVDPDLRTFAPEFVPVAEKALQLEYTSRDGSRKIYELIP